MSDCLAKQGEREVEENRFYESSYQEELQLNLDELATSVTELVQVLSPLIKQTQELTEAVGEHLHLALTLSELIKSQAAKSLASQQSRATAQLPTDQVQPMDNN